MDTVMKLESKQIDRYMCMAITDAQLSFMRVYCMIMCDGGVDRNMDSRCVSTSLQYYTTSMPLTITFDFF